MRYIARMLPRAWMLALLFLAVLAALGRGPAAVASGSMPGAPFREVGVASYISAALAGARTASGAAFDPKELVAAHRTLPFGTRVRVTNVENGRRVTVTIVDRGPFRPGRILDVSPRAARILGFLEAGTARVRVEVVGRR